jgi:4-alpha-glucanotransferase
LVVLTFDHQLGVLLHPSSVAGFEPIGTLGVGARGALQWMAMAGVTVWQVLPLCEGGLGHSPYSSPTSGLGSPWLIDLNDLAADRLLDKDFVPTVPTGGAVDFEAVMAWKRPLLESAARCLLDNPGFPLHGVFTRWRAGRPWVEDAACFRAIRLARGPGDWWDWPEPLRDREPAALDEAREVHADVIEIEVALAYLFDHQWSTLVRQAKDSGVRLVGDVPIYVAPNSVEVWAHRHLFQLSPEGRPLRVAGVPPDAFSATGQHWGNPLYDWEAMAADGYAWWIHRLRRALEWTPSLRLDHFRGFASYYAIDADAEDATGGVWEPGPGRALFDALDAVVGPQPLIAEDLGDVDEAVHELRRSTGYLATRVLQFGLDAEGEDDLHLPGQVPEDAVVYTGTHDNDTTRGWFEALDDEAAGRARRRLGCPSGGSAEVVDAAVEVACRSRAALTVVPMQDFLGLGSEARMNTPGTRDGNWAWRLKPGDLDASSCAAVRSLAEQTGRA